MSDELTLESVRWRLSTESIFMGLLSDAATNENMQKTCNQLQESIGKLELASRDLREMIELRDKIVLVATPG